jgi:hypothetical protein
MAWYNARDLRKTLIREWLMWRFGVSAEYILFLAETLWIHVRDLQSIHFGDE